MKTDIFESDVTDYRVTYLWNEITEKSGTRYILEKYKQEGMPDAGLQEVPLIRLYEMYLIAIECSDLETEYKPLVDELVAARNISVVNVSTVDLKNAFVAKEYQKEFYGEGQQFSKPNAGAIKQSFGLTQKEAKRFMYCLCRKVKLSLNN